MDSKLPAQTSLANVVNWKPYYEYIAYSLAT